MIQSSNKLIIKDPFEMPAVDDTTVLVLRECADLVPHCWIWNESVGYLEVVEYSGYDIYVTVKNVGMKENATSGTIFPSCMEFLITAPNATPIIDNTVTCLRADFKCPTVGQEALMSVDSTSAIRKGDLIIVDTRYQYLVTEIINEHTMKVLNEEKGKEGGVINVNCNECVPVKIFESTHCCEALQEQVDDIYNRLDTKKSITPATDSLVSVSNGSQVLTDAFNDVVLDVDTDLSKYNNTVSRFITSNDIPSLPDDIDLSHYDNTVSRFITLSDIPSLPDDIDLSHYDNTVSRFITSNDIPQIPTVNDATLTIYNSDGVTPFIEFSANASEAVTATLPQSGNTYTADSPLNIADNKITISQASATTDGYLSSTDWNTFNNKSGGLQYFREYKDSNNVAMFQPISGTAKAFDLGSPTNYYESGYINNINTKTLIPGGGNTTVRFKPQSSTLSDIGAFAPYEGYTNCNLGTGAAYWNKGYINNLYANNLGNYVLVSKQSLSFNFSPGGGIIPSDYIFKSGSTYAGYSNIYTFSNTFSQTVHLEILYNLTKFRLNVSSGSGNNATYELHLWWDYKLYQTGQSAPESWSSIQSVTEHCQTPSAADHACTYSLAKTATGNINVQPNYTVQIRLLFSFQLIASQGKIRTYSGWGPTTDARILGWLTN